MSLSALGGLPLSTPLGAFFQPRLLSGKCLVTCLLAFANSGREFFLVFVAFLPAGLQLTLTSTSRPIPHLYLLSYPPSCATPSSINVQVWLKMQPKLLEGVDFWFLPPLIRAEGCQKKKVWNIVYEFQLTSTLDFLDYPGLDKKWLPTFKGPVLSGTFKHYFMVYIDLLWYILINI